MQSCSTLERWFCNLSLHKSYLLFEHVDFSCIIQRLLFSRSGVGSRNANFQQDSLMHLILIQVVVIHPLKNTDLRFCKSL